MRIIERGVIATAKKAFIGIFFLLTFTLLSCNGRGSPKNSVNTIITRDGLKTMRIALELYREEEGEYPNVLEEILLKKGITERSVIEDAWGRDYQYHKLGTGYVIFSKGRDGKPYTSDDIYPPR